MSKCPADHYITSYIHNELSEKRRQSVASHLESCADCNKKYQSFLDTQKSFESIFNLTPEVQELTALRGKKIQTHLDETEDLPSNAIMALNFFKFAAAALLCFGFFHLVYHHDSPDKIEEQPYITSKLTSSSYQLHTKTLSTEANSCQYLISLQKEKSDELKNATDEKGRNITIVIDTSSLAQASTSYRLVDNHLLGLMAQMKDNDKLNVLIDGASPTLAEGDLKGLNHYEVIETIFQVRLVNLTDISQGMHDGYRVATENFNPSLKNELIVLTDKATGLTEEDKKGLINEHLKDEKSGQNKGIKVTFLGSMNAVEE